MKYFYLVATLAALAMALPLGAQDTATPTLPTAPSYPNDFVGGPEFDTTAGKNSAGTASVIKIKDSSQCYLVSARHLLGPMGGFAKETPAENVPSFVKSIKIDAFHGGSHTYSVTGLLVPSKRLDPIGGEPLDDLAVYQLHDDSPQDQAVLLTDKPPAVGDPVWVVAMVRGGVPKDQIMQSAKVTTVSNWLICQFDNDKIITAGASGAPVLNAAGEVIGVYSGHAEQDGHILAYIIPAPAILSVIKQAASAPSQ